MERRYYLRGLGVGIAVTAVIMGVMTSRDAKMTDREVIARAKELGMVESTVLLDENDEASNGEEGADADNETEEEAGAAGEDPAGDGTVPDARACIMQRHQKVFFSRTPGGETFSFFCSAYEQ